MLCWRAGCSQADIYDKCAAPLVEKFLGGANACLLAYGQTASGKTFTAGTDGGPRLIPAIITAQKVLACRERALSSCAH